MATVIDTYDTRAKRKVITLTWTDTGANTDVAPDTDTGIIVFGASKIVIQADTTNSNNTSTDIDINVESSIDGTTWDSVEYASMNLGGDEIKTMLVETGPLFIRLRVDNNDAGTTGYVTAKVLVIRREV